MLDLLSTILHDKCGIETYSPVVIGVSGGPDSLALLDSLYRLGYPLIVAHLNHRIRPEGEREALQVEKLAAERTLAYVGEEFNVPVYASEHGLSIEEAARVIRYGFLFKVASERGAQAVGVGHTADDQVETVLMHLLRGTGLAGLRGMEYATLPNPWSQTIPLIRPLLGIWRSEVLAYLNENNLQPIEDISNQDVAYFRNRVRHELIPLLETYNPGIRRALWRTSEIVKGDLAVIEQVIDQAWDRCLHEMEAGSLSFRLSDFQAQIPGVQRHLLRRAIRSLRPDSGDIDFAVIERGVRFAAEAQAGSQMELVHGLKFTLEAGILWLADCSTELPVKANWPRMEAERVVNLALPGKVGLSAHWEMRSSKAVPIHGVDDRFLKNADPYKIWVDADQLALPLVVRSRQRGDWMSPLGMEGRTVKISDLMINRKVPKRARDHWPLLCDQLGVIWIPGMHMSHRVRIRPATQRAIQLSLQTNLTPPDAPASY